SGGEEAVESGRQRRARHFDRRQRLRKRAFLEGAARCFGRLLGGRAAMQEGGRLGRQDLLRLVQLLPLQAGETSDLVEWKFGEQLEQAADVAIFAVAPELPVIVRAHRVRVEPNRTGLGLAHLAARGGRQQRRGQRQQLKTE